MDINDIRRKNLEVLIAEYKTIKAIADKLSPDKLHANYISQLRNGNREIGNEFARFLEQRLAKPHGWMDMLQSEREVIEIAMRLDPQVKQDWINNGKAMAGYAVRIQEPLSATMTAPDKQTPDKQDHLASQIINEAQLQTDAIQHAKKGKQNASVGSNRGGTAGRSGVERVRKSSRPTANPKRRVPTGG